MNSQTDSELPPVLALELLQSNPDALYSLDAVAHLSGVPRRSILIYSRTGLVNPVFLPPYGVMAFTEHAIYTVRRIEDVRAIHGINIALVKKMFDLMDEVERLRAEVRFLRKQ